MVISALKTESLPDPRGSKCLYCDQIGLYKLTLSKKMTLPISWQAIVVRWSVPKQRFRKVLM